MLSKLKEIILIVVWLGREFINAQQNFEYVNSCPQSKAEWDIRRVNKNCKDPPDYHCAAINSTQEFGEICSSSALTLPGNCPVLNAVSHNLDYTNCTSYEGCPNETYRSDEIYFFPFCFTLFCRHIGINVSHDNENSGNDQLMPVIVPIAVGLVCTIIMIIIIVFLCAFCKRKKRLSENENNQAISSIKKLTAKEPETESKRKIYLPGYDYDATPLM